MAGVVVMMVVLLWRLWLLLLGHKGIVKNMRRLRGGNHVRRHRGAWVALNWSHLEVRVDGHMHLLLRNSVELDIHWHSLLRMELLRRHRHLLKLLLLLLLFRRHLKLLLLLLELQMHIDLHCIINHGQLSSAALLGSGVVAALDLLADQNTGRSQIVSWHSHQVWAPVLAVQNMLIQPLARSEAQAAAAGAHVRQLGVQVAERAHLLLVIKGEVAVQQMLLKVIGPVELALLVWAHFAREGALESSNLQVSAQVARQIAAEVLAANLALVLLLHGSARGTSGHR